MHRLGRADTEQDSQDHRIGDPLGLCRVEAGATLLDRGEMERRSIGDRLEVVLRRQVEIAPGDRRKALLGNLAGNQVRNRRLKDAKPIKIGIMVRVAVPSPPSGIDEKLRQVGEPFTDIFFINPCRCTALQGPKFVQIDWLLANRNQKRVNEVKVRELILGIVVDILIHVPVEDFQRIGLSCATAPARYFFILNSSKLVVLLPQVRLKDFNRGEKL
jgi:hypothetical protein